MGQWVDARVDARVVPSIFSPLGVPIPLALLKAFAPLFRTFGQWVARFADIARVARVRTRQECGRYIPRGFIRGRVVVVKLI